MQYSIITETGSYIPTTKVPNNNFKSNLFYDADGKQIQKTNDEIISKLAEITGINERKYASDDFTTSDIAFFAAEMALQSVDKETLDYIIFAHNYGEIKPNNNRIDIIPTLAARLKHKLKIVNPYTVAYDVPFGCPGWIHGLILADNHIRLGQAKRVLVIGADILSRASDPHDMDSMIYADGAGATLIEATDQKTGILSHVTRSDTFSEAFLFRLGKSYNPELNNGELYSKMDGQKLYQYAVDKVPLVVKQSLDKAGFSLKDVRKILIHQANEKMDEAILKNLFRLYQIKTIPSHIMPMTISRLGNSSVATIPTMLDLIKRGELKGHQLNPGDLIVFASVGAGMNINAMVYRMPEGEITISEKESISYSEEMDIPQPVAKKVLSEDPSKRIKILEDYLCQQVTVSLSKLNAIEEIECSINDCLRDLDFDSLSVIDFQTNVKHDFGIEIPFKVLLGDATIHDLAKILLEYLTSVSDREDITNGGNKNKSISEERWVEGAVQSNAEEKDITPKLNSAKTPYELITQLADLRVFLSAEEGNLKYRALEGVIDETLTVTLQQFRDELLTALKPWPGYQLLSPLSYNQQSLFFLNLFEPSATAYNLALSMRFKSPVDTARMKKAFEELLQRHEQLRTTYCHVEFGDILIPVQFTHEAIAPVFEIYDVHECAESELTKRLQDFYQQPFDLEKGPVVRAGLFVKNHTEAMFVIALHHIVSDGWSMSLIRRDLASAYRGELRNTEKIARGAEYTEFALAQRRNMETAAGREHLDYWVNEHKIPAPPLDLRNTMHRPAVRRSIGATHYFQLDPAIRDAAEQTARKEGITTFALMLSVFEWLLFERSGNSDVAIGIPIIGHNERKFENTVGYFVNPIPLRSKRSGSISFLEHARTTAQELRMALDHREAPFAAVVEHLGGARDISRTPVFQSMFHMLTRSMLGDVIDLLYPFESPLPVDFGGLAATACALDQQNGQFDLTLELIDNGKNILGLLKYCTDIFTTADAEDLASAFCERLKIALANPETVLFSSSEALSTSTQEQQTPAPSLGDIDPKIIEWNKTDRDYPLDKCLQSFIEEQVAKTPDAPALTYEDITISYSDLNKRVNQLAHFLQTKGIGPDTPVGVCTFRSMEMVIALLAIVKAGGAYVPFDPTYPVKRLSFMIADSKVPIILAQKSCAALLEGVSSQIVYFEDIEHQLEAMTATNPPTKTTPDHLAYVIYTSGSTGNPKGAMNTHRGIVNRLLWMQETFQIDASDTLVQKTPFSFDVSVWEFFWPFMCGARLVVAKPEGHRDADYLLDLIHKEKITIIHFVPSMLRLFLDRADQERCMSFRHVVLSGEALTIDLQKRYFSILKAPLHNLYGPTEAAVDVSYWQCDPQSQSDIVPIGKPVSNTKLYILDENLRSLPVGESGELHIGGVQVARGYLNRPDLTAAKFIPDPFADYPEARMYKTGDLCRFLPDGNIEYLGRIDFQVKIRGNRIELGEIETAILKDSSVKDCVVMVREDTPGEQRLVAYIIENQGSRFSISAMRRKLAAELPDYMIPAFFVMLPAFPLSPSGKTDRLALPKPGQERPELANAYIAPRGETERLVAAIWQDILHVDKVGLDDNFFDLGGHSLLLVRMAGVFKKSFSKEVSVIELFEHPTVREQAKLIRGAEEETEIRKTSSQDEWEDGII